MNLNELFTDEKINDFAKSLKFKTQQQKVELLKSFLTDLKEKLEEAEE